MNQIPCLYTLPVKKYYDGINNQVFIVEKTKDPVEISTIIDWVNSDNAGTKIKISADEIIEYNTRPYNTYSC